jgi:two-component system sensor histidine kinase DegS
VQDFEEKTKIRAVFETSGRELRMPSAMEAAVYRLVQEAFSNALKHASPTYVSLEMTFFPKRILIVIQDNGVGFDVEQTMARSKTSSHYGLIGMHERVELLNGKIDIESARGQGTKITISIPVSTDL